MECIERVLIAGVVGSWLGKGCKLVGTLISCSCLCRQGIFEICFQTVSLFPLSCIIEKTLPQQQGNEGCTHFTRVQGQEFVPSLR